MVDAFPRGQYWTLGHRLDTRWEAAYPRFPLPCECHGSRKRLIEALIEGNSLRPECKPLKTV
jgi:hypothetical protein